MNFHQSNHTFFCHFSIYSLCFRRNSFHILMHYSWIIWQLKLIWVLTGNISIEPRGPEVDALAQLWPSVPSQIVQLCDGRGWSALFTLPLPPVFCSINVVAVLTMSSYPLGQVVFTWLDYFPWQNSQIPSNQQISCLGTHCLGSLTNLLFIVSCCLFHPCSPGFWLHVFTNCWQCISLNLKHSALAVAGH